MAGKLDNQVAIITGGARGQGAATARLFAAEGAHVVVADILEAEGTKLAREVGATAVFRKLDVTNEDQWRQTVAETEQRWGHVDILINNAGSVPTSSGCWGSI
jgi:3alpha(or 20beta)-hydroxysteroid dehydrogenase